MWSLRHMSEKPKVSFRKTPLTLLGFIASLLLWVVQLWYFLLKGCGPSWDKTYVWLSSMPVTSILSHKKIGCPLTSYHVRGINISVSGGSTPAQKVSNPRVFLSFLIMSVLAWLFGDCLLYLFIQFPMSCSITLHLIYM